MERHLMIRTAAELLFVVKGLKDAGLPFQREFIPPVAAQSDAYYLLQRKLQEQKRAAAAARTAAPAKSKLPDGPDRVGVFRAQGIEFTELTRTENCILDRLWNAGRYGQIPQQDLAKAVQQDPMKRPQPDSLKKAIQRLNRKLKKQSDGRVFIISKNGIYWLAPVETGVDKMGDKMGDKIVR
jgi:hypothetical protein